MEIAGQKKGFLAFKPTEDFTSATGQNGFELGTELVGNKNLSILHMILSFGDDHVYDIFLNLTSPVVRDVLKVWEETKDHFFFAFLGNSFTAFDQTLGEAWYRDNYFQTMDKANYTEARYQGAVDALKDGDLVQGRHIDLIFQNETEFLDLTANRFEVKSK
ncbi:MAG: hypothetical protein GY710_13160 [Desulfobacteraceae bacterium]|nr:hypothetical protein [Desulfobacteraceae bacterium]